MNASSAGLPLSRAVAAALLPALAALLVPGALVAQLCLGSPVAPGQFGLGGYYTTVEDQTGYGAEVSTNLDGPLAISGSIGVIDVDGMSDNIFTVGAGAAWEVPQGTLSICPTVRVEYARFPDSFLGTDIDASVIGVPLGVAAGTSFGEGTVRFIPSGELGLLWSRLSTSGTVAGVEFSETDTETDFYLRLGVTGVSGRIFARVGLDRIFEDDAENVIRISAGFLF